MVTTRDIRLYDGRVLRVHDSAGAGSAGAGSPQTGARPFTILWFHGTPQTGALLEPLVAAAAARGIRMLSYGRPSYGGSSSQPGRTVADAAADVGQLADALELDTFAVMGASGGGPHALACAALLPGRVSAVACLATLAPLNLAPVNTDGIDWFSGMISDGALRSAMRGREARVRYEETAEFDPQSFVDSDYAALETVWTSLGADVGLASAAGSDGAIDDDLAYVAPWGFEPADITVPVLLAHGGRDRVVPPSHAHWLLDQCRDGELWLRPNDGHIAVLNASSVAMDWLREHARD
jgi:pimeloyl-ACP methyl ester carboxylesterase